MHQHQRKCTSTSASAHAPVPADVHQQLQQKWEHVSPDLETFARMFWAAQRGSMRFLGTLKDIQNVPKECPKVTQNPPEKWPLGGTRGVSGGHGAAWGPKLGQHAVIGGQAVANFGAKRSPSGVK